ncbi:MAG: hypothetical protein CMJ54_10690 [Planctomycetaceae bacterium]|nr:hypothetical protein [Planctomycetaceae bacterium]
MPLGTWNSEGLVRTDPSLLTGGQAARKAPIDFLKNTPHSTEIERGGGVRRGPGARARFSRGWSSR